MAAGPVQNQRWAGPGRVRRRSALVFGVLALGIALSGAAGATTGGSGTVTLAPRVISYSSEGQGAGSGTAFYQARLVLQPTVSFVKALTGTQMLFALNGTGTLHLVTPCSGGVHPQCQLPHAYETFTFTFTDSNGATTSTVFKEGFPGPLASLVGFLSGGLSVNPTTIPLPHPVPSSADRLARVVLTVSAPNTLRVVWNLAIPIAAGNGAPHTPAGTRPTAPPPKPPPPPPPWPWIGICLVIIGLVALLIALYGWTRHRRKRRTPVCRCGLDVTIDPEGHDDDELSVCTCGNVTYTLNPPDASETTLVVRFNELGNGAVNGFSRQFAATVVPTCQGGGSIRNIVYDWSAQVSDPTSTGQGSITLTCTVHATLVCPGQPPRTLVDTGTTTIPLHTAPPIIQVVLRRAGPAALDFGHASIRFICGTMDTVCGFGPRGSQDGVKLVLGADAVADEEASESGAVSSAGLPGIGQDLKGVNPQAPAGFSVWTYDVTCNQFDTVVNHWNALIKQSNLGAIQQFKLTRQNCVIEVQRSLLEAGLIGSVDATRPMALVDTLGDANRTDVGIPPK